MQIILSCSHKKQMVFISEEKDNQCLMGNLKNFNGFSPIKIADCKSQLCKEPSQIFLSLLEGCGTEKDRLKGLFIKHQDVLLFSRQKELLKEEKFLSVSGVVIPSGNNIKGKATGAVVLQ
ncbi:MAG: hypothetical protein MSH10_00285 [Pygmaiobacter massiliensis]|nr:hypothetical protein [Pygmaiobacter massiliensis]